MRTAPILDRLAGLGAAKWEVHVRARTLARAGRDIIEMTIGEPDVPTPPVLVDAAAAAMRAGRTGYSDGRGEPGLRAALAARYSARTGQAVGPDRFICVPGTQTALYLTMMALTGPGDEVLAGDPMYATYEGVIRAGGAALCPVPLDPAQGFRLSAASVAAAVTPRSRVILLNSPHNPTGAVLTARDIAEIGEVARAHDLWIVADEVYEDLVFPGTTFASPLADPALADRTLVVSSISKSHAAPGFRSGWIVAPAPLVDAMLPLAETMLFGNQPFIADMTERAVRDGSPVAAGMAARFSARADRLATALGNGPLGLHLPRAGMFAMVDIRATGLSGLDYALDLLEAEGVAVMPGSSFGDSVPGWVRIALTVPDEAFDRGLARILRHARARSAGAQLFV